MTAVPTGLRRRWWLAALVTVLGTGCVAVVKTRAFDATVAATWLAALVRPAAIIVTLPSLAVFLRDYLAVTRGFRKAKANGISGLS